MKSGFGQLCPIAVACEIFAERWTPLILRELLAGTEQFNDLHRGLPLISRPLLSRRLRELERAGVITMEPLPTGKGYRYRLTQAGQEFRPVLEGLGTWGQRWTIRVHPGNLDPSVLMWNIRRRIALDRAPEHRTVLHFSFRGVPARYRGPRLFWLMVERKQAELCIEDPGFEVDVYVDADVAALASVWLGDCSLDEARRAKAIALAGSTEAVRLFPSLLPQSRFASVPRPSASGTTRCPGTPARDKAARASSCRASGRAAR